jgi:hypothetical protein
MRAEPLKVTVARLAKVWIQAIEIQWRTRAIRFKWK